MQLNNVAIITNTIIKTGHPKVPRTEAAINVQIV